MSLAKFSVKQPVLMNLLTLFLIVAGLLSLSMIPREIFPSFPPGKITIMAVYPGVSPKEMESLVATKIEREIKDIRGIDEIFTESSEGLMRITVTTEDGISEEEVSRISLDIQAAIGRISDFPLDMDKPVVSVARLEIPVMWLGISSELPEITTREMAKDLQKKLEELKGVSSVQLLGTRDLEIQVEVDPDYLKAHNLTISQIMNVIKAHSQDIPGGSMKFKKGEYLIRILGKETSVKGLENLVVKAGATGIIHLKDIATVKETLKDPSFIGRVNGSRSIYLAVNKKMTGDAINVSDSVKDFLKYWHKKAPKGINAFVLFDVSKYIKRRQNTMYSNGLTGLILVVILLFLFLSFKAAILTALGIPVAFFGTFVVMKLMGITMNMLSMFAMIVSLGMLVDDAIVVVENVYRYLMMGYSPKEAAIKGAEEVMWPVIGSVTTTIVAFSTLTMMPGEMGKILGVIPLVVSIALGVSLIEALFVLPSHMAEFMKTPKNMHVTEDGTSTGEAKWFLAFQNGFAWILRGITRIWPVSIMIFIGIFIYTLHFAATQMEFIPFPSNTITRANINIETVVGSKIEYTESIVEKFEKEILKSPDSEIESFWCMLGSIPKGKSTIQGSHLAQCTVNFANDGETKPHTPKFLLNKWRTFLLAQPDVETFNVSVQRKGPPAGSPIEIQIRGPDSKKAEEISEKIIKHAYTLPGVTDVYNDIAGGKRELIVQVNKERAAMYGLNASTVGLLIRRSFAGGIAAKIQKGDDDEDIVVKFPDSKRRNIREILDMEIFSPVLLKRIPFKSLASIHEGRGPGRLTRVDQKRTITVSGEIDTNITNTTRVNHALKKFTKQLELSNPDYKIVYEGESKTSDDLAKSMKLAAILALLGIYIILATIFQSFLQPFIVLMAVPFGAIGVIAGLWFHNLPISMTGMMGVVALLGVVVNDSLVLVDFINNARKNGMPLREAVIEGGRLRLRPVILTTVTTVMGLLPMGLGLMGSEEFLQPMALAIVWGLSFATTLTLFLVPCTYLMIDKITRFFKTVFRFILPKKEVVS